MLSEQAVMYYQKIFKQTFGEEITHEEAERQGSGLLRLFRIIYRPIQKGWLNQIQKGGVGKDGNKDKG